MAALEPNQICTAKYYEERRVERVMESRLGKQALYAFYMRMDSGPIEAFRVAARAKLEYEAGALAVNVVVLDNDLKPVFHNHGEMDGGIWIAARYEPLRIQIDEDHVNRVAEGYFMDYDEGLNMPTVEAAQSIPTPQDLAGI